MSEKILEQLGFSDDYVFAPPPGRARKASRYIFFPGNLMGEKQRLSAEHLYLGGDNLGTDYPSLAPTNFVLNRCRITPLTLRPRPLPADEVIMNPQELEVMHTEGATNPRIQLVKTYPNDQINGLVYSDGNLNGKIELTALRGIEFLDDDGRIISQNAQKILEIQTFFFPNWNEVITRKAHLPKTLREIEHLIITAKNSTSNEVLTKTADEMLEACGRFRTYGLGQLEKDAIRIQAGLHPQGYVHSYSDTSTALLEQLEIQRESFTGRNQSANLDDKFAQLAEGQNRLTDFVIAQAEKQQNPKVAKAVKEQAEKEAVAA